MPPIINSTKCSQCGTCINICPEDILFMPSKDQIPEVLYKDECWHCAACVIDCPEQAINLYIPLPMRLYKQKY